MDVVRPCLALALALLLLPPRRFDSLVSVAVALGPCCLCQHLLLDDDAVILETNLTPKIPEPNQCHGFGKLFPDTQILSVDRVASRAFPGQQQKKYFCCPRDESGHSRNRKGVRCRWLLVHIEPFPPSERRNSIESFRTLPRDIATASYHVRVLCGCMGRAL